MSERKLTKEQSDRLQQIHKEWLDEVTLFFEAQNEKLNSNQLDGPETWGLVAIEQKYKKKINTELGIDFYKDVVGVEKSGHKRFSDLIIKNPNGFPNLPERE